MELEYAESKKSIAVNKKKCKESKEEPTSCRKKDENTSVKVHSLATVIALKMEVSDGAASEGLQCIAMSALANISGGMSAVVQSLGERIKRSSNDNKMSDIIGALVCAFEALASLYNNDYFHRHLDHAEAKKLLIGLLSRASTEVHQELIQSLKDLCATRSNKNILLDNGKDFNS